MAAIAATIFLALGSILYWIPSDWTLDHLALPFFMMLFVYSVPIGCGLIVYQELRMDSGRHVGSISWMTVTVVAMILTSYALFMYWLWTV
jgi:hypothetical protein